ncbi:E3 ubiquitin/ISG15 ligase TRIM25-like [Anomaloglossus baeobatrachus]
MAASADLSEELNCSICLQIYSDPVSLRCGHNFCRICIEKVFNSQNQPKDYKCPDCRQVFCERPELQRNITVCNIVERFQCAKLQDAGIFCTYCVHFPVPAVKSCIMCEAALCNMHLKVHSKTPEHVLTEPTASMENRRCLIHRKILEYYCTEDATCICVSCRLDGQHGGHHIQTLLEAGEKKKNELRSILQELKPRKEDIEKEVQRLHRHRRKVEEKSAKMKEKVCALFRDLRRRLSDLESRLQSDVSGQEEQASLAVSGLIQRLELKKDEVSRRMSYLEELCSMADPMAVLQEPPLGKHGCSDIKEEQEPGDLDVAVISGTLQTELSHILTDGKYVIHDLEASDISLDVNTAGSNIKIAGNLKILSWTHNQLSQTPTPQRFQYSQVLSVQSFSAGRHYWDVECSKWGDWRIGVSYASAQRSGEHSWIGHNKKSWCL